LAELKVCKACAKACAIKDPDLRSLGMGKVRSATGIGQFKRQGRPYVLGLTGGIASGKSSVLKAFERCHWRVLSADQLVHKIYEEAGISREEIRQKLMGLASKPQVLNREIKKLEAWLHPKVREKIRAEINRPSLSPLIVEVPLLFESKAKIYQDFDFNLLIFTPKEERKKRALGRGMKAKIFEELDARQWPAQKKAQLADLVLFNFNATSPKSRVSTKLPKHIEKLVQSLDQFFGRKAISKD
jgi:dephospho-CoA kinase